MAQKSKKYQSLAVVTALLGVVAMPAAAGAATTSTTVSSDVGSAISITSSGNVAADVTPTSSAVQTIASDTVTVNTNNSTGYTLLIADSDATNTLAASGGSSIPALGGTVASPAAQTANTWGFRVDNEGGFGAGPTSAQSNGTIGALEFAGVPINSAPATIKTTSDVASNDQTTVWYGVAADNTQPTGSYSGQVTYTATAN